MEHGLCESDLESDDYFENQNHHKNTLSRLSEYFDKLPFENKFTGFEVSGSSAKKKTDNARIKTLSSFEGKKVGEQKVGEANVKSPFIENNQRQEYIKNASGAMKLSSARDQKAIGESRERLNIDKYRLSQKNGKENSQNATYRRIPSKSSNDKNEYTFREKSSPGEKNIRSYRLKSNNTQPNEGFTEEISLNTRVNTNSYPNESHSRKANKFNLNEALANSESKDVILFKKKPIRGNSDPIYKKKDGSSVYFEKKGEEGLSERILGRNSVVKYVDLKSTLFDRGLRQLNTKEKTAGENSLVYIPKTKAFMMKMEKNKEIFKSNLIREQIADQEKVKMRYEKFRILKDEYMISKQGQFKLSVSETKHEYEKHIPYDEVLDRTVDFHLIASRK